MMKTNKKQDKTLSAQLVIRDFVYLDGALLASYFSQIFKGVTERVVEGSTEEIISINEQQGLPLSGASMQKQAEVGSSRNESRVLHDHMFSMLEEELADVIIDTATAEEEDLRENLANAFLVRASGAASLEDYARLAHFIANFNQFGDALGHFRHQSAEVQEMIQNLEHEVRHLTGQQKAEAQQALKQLRDPRQANRALGLHQDEKTLMSLNLVLRSFHEDNFEVVVHPKNQGLAFRSILDRTWLRIDPQFLRSLYGGSSQFDLTLLGQVTLIPDVGSNPQTEVSEAESLGGAFQQMFKASNGVEQAFRGADSDEVVVRPLAIYRQAVIPKRAIPES